MAQGNPGYDFYILNQEGDMETAVNILRILEARGHRGYFVDRDAMPGQSVIVNHEDALNNSAYIIVVISNESITCGWWKFLTDTTLHHRVNNPELFETIIPMYMPDFDAANQQQSLQIFTGCTYDPDQTAPVWDKLSNCFSNQ